MLTHHAREPLEMEGGTTFHFVTDGVAPRSTRRMAAAGDKDVQVHGGGSAVSQYLARGLLDELSVHVAPVFLGSGTRAARRRPRRPARAPRDVRVSDTGVTHIRYAVVK